MTVSSLARIFKGRKNFVGLIVGLMALFALSPVALGEDGYVLIVNSDNAIPRYQKIADEFKAIVGAKGLRWQEVDLRGGDSDSKLESMIEKEPPSVFFSVGAKAYLVTRSHAKGKNVLFSAAINWRRLGIDDNAYGVSNELTPIQEIALMRFVLPWIKKIGILYSPSISREYVDVIKRDAAELGIEMFEQKIESDSSLVDGLNDLFPKIDMLWLIADPSVISSLDSVQQIFRTAKKLSKPVYSYSDIYIRYGAVLSVSADTATIGRQAANLLMSFNAGKVAPGTVQFPAGSTITLNRCVLDELHLSYNQDALDSINKIVGCYDVE